MIKLSKYINPIDNKIEKAMIKTGKNQKVASNSFQKNSNFFIPKR